MPVVVDASAIAAIFLDEPERDELASYLQDQTLLAPTLIDYELTNIAVKYARRRPSLRDQIVASFALALKLPISRVAVPPVELVELASATGLTAYDASYLWLAHSRDLELVSLDAKLMRVWEGRHSIRQSP